MQANEKRIIVAMMVKEPYSRAGRNVNLIPGVSQDEAGVIHTAYGSYHPVTGEGLPINAPEELMQKILIALIDDSLESGPAEPFDWDKLMAEKLPDDQSNCPLK